MADGTSSRAAPVTGDGAPSLAGLLSGIVGDLHTLVRQELQLARRELRAELDRAKFGFAFLAAGAGLLALAVVPLLFMVVYLIKAYTTIPEWGCFGIVAAGFVLVGGLLVAAGVAKVRHLRLVPPLTAQTMRANLRWLKNPR